MNREFLEHYERELKILYERSVEFAEEFPGIAERLGGLTEEKMDPGLAGLLEGSAYMAARVQLKLKSEFAEFTTNLLEQLLPNYLAPTPSALLAQAKPNFEDPNLAEGLKFPPGSYIDAVYVEQERRVSCRYRISSPLTLWPVSVEKAEYYATPAPMQALGLEVGTGTVAGLRLNIHRRTGQPEEDVDRTNADGKASSVQFIHFAFTDAQIRDFIASTQVVVGFSHAQYAHMVVLQDETVAALAKDFHSL